MVTEMCNSAYIRLLNAVNDPLKCSPMIRRVSHNTLLCRRTGCPCNDRLLLATLPSFVKNIYSLSNRSTLATSHPALGCSGPILICAVLTWPSRQPSHPVDVSREVWHSLERSASEFPNINRTVGDVPSISLAEYTRCNSLVEDHWSGRSFRPFYWSQLGLTNREDNASLPSST